MKLQGKIALVTGASRGIGRGIALRLAAEGAMVAVNFQSNAEAADAVVREIVSSGQEAFAVQGDVGAREGIAAMFRTLDAELTRRTGANQFDILVNNAGIFMVGNVESSKEEEFDRTFAVDVKGPFFVAQQAIARLRDFGRIINLSSGLSKHPSPEYAVYCMAKAAINMFSVVLAGELGPRGITVNAVGPGVTASDMTADLINDPHARQGIVSSTALGRIGQAEDIAAVVAYLASADAGWVTGQYIEASGGLGLHAF